MTAEILAELFEKKEVADSIDSIQRNLYYTCFAAAESFDIYNFMKHFNMFLDNKRFVENYITQLKNCKFQKTDFKGVIDELQNRIDDYNTEAYSLLLSLAKGFKDTI